MLSTWGGGGGQRLSDKPVGTSGSPYLFTFEEGILNVWIGGLAGLGLKGAGSKIARGGEPAHDATVTVSPFWNCPTHCITTLPRGGWGGVLLGLEAQRCRLDCPIVMSAFAEAMQHRCQPTAQPHLIGNRATSTLCQAWPP